MAPAIEEAPAKCGLNIAKSTEKPECAGKELNGGYTVQPVPTPISVILDKYNKLKEGIKSQKERLFNLGKAISGLPNNMGTNQLPNAPINKGMTIKNIIIKACEVTITLYN